MLNFSYKKQINRLYLSSLLNELSITGAWVAILAARGFSLVQIGLAETIFHATSLLFEIPSGALADVVGRKNSLILSCLSSITGCLIMALSNGFGGVCFSFVFHALGYNFASGSNDALAYDSLKLARKEGLYERYSSNQMIIYRITSGLSTLLAGVALLIGYRMAYLISVINHVLSLIVILGLKEVSHTDDQISDEGKIAPYEMPETDPRTKSGKKEQCILVKMAGTFSESLKFLWGNKKAAALMFANSFVGAFDILLLFFLQSKLRDSGLGDSWLGIALFIMEMGGILGSKLILKMQKCRYAVIFLLGTLGVLTGILLEHTGIAVVMTLGGFISAVADDALQVRTDVKLQDMFSSSQRATLISISSFTFSVIMIVLSPLAGWVFTVW